MLRPDRTIMPLEYMDLGSFPTFFQPYIKNSREILTKEKENTWQQVQ